MPWPTWQESGTAALVSALLVFLLRRFRPSRASMALIPAAWEFSFVAALYTLWRLARKLPIAHEDGALERARQIAVWQDRLFLPSEANIQRWVIERDWLAWFTSVYYATVHVPALIAFLIWMWVRHREHYHTWRTALAILTGFCLVVRFLRVAPPRFLPEYGFVDLSNRIGISVYGPVGSGISDQFAAMPSIHVAWAAIVSFGVFAVSPSRWRWVVLSHVFVTVWVVAATGHHWWADGIVAVAFLVVGLWMNRVGRQRRVGRLAWLSPDRPEPPAGAVDLAAVEGAAAR
ncbi:MAG: phosphatase PAP2 family protein [Actinomycetota bacterium]|nr:phosphatase PAP2 family protein [Actinomycetota bacterium]